jgi:hypothetical protein
MFTYTAASVRRAIFPGGRRREEEGCLQISPGRRGLGWAEQASPWRTITRAV